MRKRAAILLVGCFVAVLVVVWDPLHLLVRGQIRASGAAPTTGRPDAVMGEGRPRSSSVGIPNSSAVAGGGAGSGGQLNGTPAEQALEAYRRWARYPPSSRPVTDEPDQRLPHPRVRTVRPLDPKGHGEIEIRQEQDRLYLVPGETAVVGLSASRGGVMQTVAVDRADLVRLEGTPPQPSSSLALVMFNDDGVPPDVAGEDGALTATVSPPDAVLGTFTGDLRLIVTLHVGSEQGVVSFPFVYTGQPPAKFTGTIREAVENGSLAIYLGVQVERPGRYVAIGRLYDSSGEAVAMLHFNDVVSAGNGELRLLAFGKLLLDQGASSPFTLQDVQGWRMTEQGSPDRELMDMWAGPYVTASYPAAAFSDREWESPTKQRRLQALQTASR